MAYAQCDQYGACVVNVTETGWIRIAVGQISINVAPDDAPAVRDALSRAITEAAQKHAQATAKAADAEGAQA